MSVFGSPHCWLNVREQMAGTAHSSPVHLPLTKDALHDAWIHLHHSLP